jgi:UDP-N-acetylmuramoyl-tripeptide--D-alanyl-D-alanine ligase
MNFELFYETAGICTDTRNIQKDCLFICLKGANFNGNEFAEKAIQAGAKYVIADEKIFKNNEQIFIVENALKYLQKLANFHRKKFNIPIIGITGSNGKTTSKELIATVLSKKYNVHYTLGNLNNHVGVPLTLLQLNEAHEIAVIEMGANKFHDIQELCEITEPSHGIITNIGMAHLEGFINFEGVLNTKLELYDSVSFHKGCIFVNNDDPVLTQNLPKNVEIVSYASESNAAITGKLISLSPFVEMNWEKEGFESTVIQTQMIGKYNFYNFLAAVCIGNYFGVEETKISAAIAEYSPTNNRSQVQKTAKNTLILDAYNANPTSMKSALESFAIVENSDKIVILGDMFELGNESANEHQKIIDLISKLNLEAICIGHNFNSILKDNNAKIKSFETKETASTHIQKLNLKNKMILLKGSRGIGLESIVPFL